MAQPLPAMASVGNAVRNWNSWVTDFFRTYIAPLNQCAEELLRQFGNVSEEFVEYVRLIHDLTDKILSKAGLTAGSAIARSTITEELLGHTACSIEKFLEYAINSSAGHNPFMFFAWSIRTTTPIHFRAYYGDPGNYMEVLNRLGYGRLQNTPQPANSCLWCDLSEYALHGYPDWVINANVKHKVEYRYFTAYFSFEGDAKNKFISNATTLGGLLARLNEAIWSMINNVDWLSTLYYYRQEGSTKSLKDSLIDYAWKVNKSLEQVGNQYGYHYVCRNLSPFCSTVTLVSTDSSSIASSITTLLNALDNKFNSLFIGDEPGSHIYLVHGTNACEGQAYSYSDYSKKRMILSWCSYMDMVIPQVMLGRLELVNINMDSLRSELGVGQVQFIGAYSVFKRWL